MESVFPTERTFRFSACNSLIWANLLCQFSVLILLQVIQKNASLALVAGAPALLTCYYNITLKQHYGC